MGKKEKEWKVGDEGYFFDCSGFQSLCNKRFRVNSVPDEDYPLYGIDFLIEGGEKVYPMAAHESELHREPVQNPKYPVGVLGYNVEGVVRGETL